MNSKFITTLLLAATTPETLASLVMAIAVAGGGAGLTGLNGKVGDRSQTLEDRMRKREQENAERKRTLAEMKELTEQWNRRLKGGGT